MLLLSYNRLSDQLVFAFSVDKLITEHLPHIYTFLYLTFIFFFSQNLLGRVYQRPRINAIASRDQCQRIQISAIDDFSSLFATIRFCSPPFALSETIRTIRTIRYSLFGFFPIEAS